MDTKIELGYNFSKKLFGDDFSREFVYRGRFLRRNRPQAVWGLFLLETISPGDDFSRHISLSQLLTLWMKENTELL